VIEALEWTVSLLSNGDLLMVLRDVSEARRAGRERERMEQQLLQQDKMEAIGRMAGGIAHDFNNLLGAMLGYAEFLVSDLPAGSTERDYAVRLASVGERAKDLVRQILTFSRGGADRLEPVSLPAVVGDARTILRSALPVMTELTFEVDPDLPPARANATQLVQILMNLALNAHDAARDGGAGGHICIRIRRGGGERRGPDGRDELVPLPFPAGRPHLVIEVEDDGQGMSPETLRRIFEPFFTTKGKGKGTGLGMPLVYGIVKAHGGGIEIRSAPGRGTLVRVLIPAAAALEAEPQPAPAPAAVPARRGWRVLVVDDEPAMGDMLREGLRRHEHRVFVCDDPLRALRILQADPFAFDAVITDQAMPGITGMELIGRIKALRADLPCLLYTGYSERANAEAAQQAGADAFLYKPVVVADIAALLDRLATDTAAGTS
jgi:signal transduction histidine kinase/CheY-like chemotaxis protein